MQARVLLWICLALNVVLTSMIVLLARATRESASSAAAVPAKEEPREIKTNVVIRRQPFSWNEIESQDYPTFIANLRRIGCPERTIRDIIIAEVNDLYAEKLAREMVVPEQKWWLPDPDMDSFQAGMDDVRRLEGEKQQLLTQLLGQGWNDQRQFAPASAVRFDGPVLSAIPTATKAHIERIEANARRRLSELEDGRASDPAELARLRQETRRELAALLTPAQLEEYLLRYSDTAERMRAELRGFGAGPEEFRRIFRIRDTYDQQLAALTGNDPATAARRAELAQLRDQTIKNAISPERFQFYQLTSNPLFRQAQENVQQNGAPAEKVLPIFRINLAVQEEMARIQADRSISEDQRRVALAAVQQQQQNSIERILGGQPAEELVAAPSPAPAQPLLPPMPDSNLVPPGALVTPR